MTETYCSQLQTVIGEFKNISPEITSAFVFKKNGEINASNEAATQDQIKKMVTVFNDIADQAHVLGEVEALTIQGADRQLNISCINNHYLATISSHAANPTVVKSLTHVIVPTIIELLDHASPQPSLTEQPQAIKLEDTPVEPPQVLPIEEPVENEPVTEPSADPPVTFEPMLPDPPSTQLMVEKMGGY